MKHLSPTPSRATLTALTSGLLLLGACSASTSESSEENFTAYDSHLMSGTSKSDYEVQVSTEGLPPEARSLLTCFAQQGDSLWTDHFPCFEHAEAFLERRFDERAAIEGFRRTLDGSDIQAFWRKALNGLADLCTRFYPETPDSVETLNHLSELTSGFDVAPHDLPLRIFGHRCDARASFPQSPDCFSAGVSLHPDRRLQEALTGTLKSSIKILPRGSNLTVQCHHESGFREFGPNKASVDGKSYVERVSRPAHAAVALRDFLDRPGPFIDLAVAIADTRPRELRLSFAPLVQPPRASPRYGDPTLKEFKVLYVHRSGYDFEETRQSVVAQGYRVLAEGTGMDGFPGRSSVLTKEVGNGKSIKLRMIENDMYSMWSDTGAVLGAQAPARRFAEEAQFILYPGFAGYPKIGTLDGVYAGDPARYRIDLVLTKRSRWEGVNERSQAGMDMRDVDYSAGIRDHLSAATLTSGLSVVEKVGAGMMGVGARVTYNQMAEEDHSFTFGKTAPTP